MKNSLKNIYVDLFPVVMGGVYINNYSIGNYSTSSNEQKDGNSSVEFNLINGLPLDFNLALQSNK